MELWYTIEDLSLEFDDLPVKEVNDEEVIDTYFLNSVLTETQTFIMTYLRKMKTLKDDTPTPLVILELKSCYMNIARYKYSNKSNVLTQAIIDRYKEDVEYLREVAAGKVLLGELPTKVGLINRKLQRG